MARIAHRPCEHTGLDHEGPFVVSRQFAMELAKDHA